MQEEEHAPQRHPDPNPTGPRLDAHKRCLIGTRIKAQQKVRPKRKDARGGSRLAELVNQESLLG